MMGKMREWTKGILYFLIVAFIALMVFEWGADYSGWSQRRQFVVGKVNGQEIDLETFNQTFRNARLNEEQRNGKNLTEEQINNLRNQVWEQLVQRVLLKKEIEKLNIQVTGEDVTNYVRSGLYQQYRDNPNFQTDGRFDPRKLDEALADDTNRPILLALENQAREELPYVKLQSLIYTSVFVTEQEIRDEFKQQNLKAKIEYLTVPLSAFADYKPETGEEEIRKYYEKNKNDFKNLEMRQLNYVYFSINPTAGDSARVYRRAEEIKAQALAGKDFTALADAESEDPSVASNHGDLGYFERKDMVAEFSEAAFAARPGEIVGPVETNFGLHVIKVVDKKTEDGKEKVRASHILLKFEASSSTIDEAQRQSGLFAEIAREEGFSVAADQLKLEIKKTTEFANNKIGQIPGIGKIESALMWAFSSEKEAVSDVYYTPQGYYVFQIASIKPEGYKPFDEVKELCQNRIDLEKRKNKTREYAEKFAGRVNAGEDFRAIAQSDPEGILQADTTDYFGMNIFVPRIGRAPAITANAFNLPLGQPSGALETERGYYFIRVKDRNQFDEEAFSSQREGIRNRLLQQKSRTIFTQWYEKLKEQAKIEDNRYRFFRG